MVIDYNAILNKIGEQIIEIKNKYSEYKDIDFEVADEQAFLSENHDTPSSTYIVVRFTGASTSLEQAVLPVTLTVMGFPNEIEKTQDFFNKFISEFNLKVDGDTTQLWMSPQVILNFGEVLNTYRSLFTVSGQFLIGNGTIRLEKLTYYYTNENQELKSEVIPIIGFSDVSEASLNPQPLTDKKGRVNSYGSFITNAFSIVTYPNKNLQFIKDIWKWKYDFSNKHQNDNFNLNLNFGSGVQSCGYSTWKCRSANFNQRIGDIPTVQISFMR